MSCLSPRPHRLAIAFAALLAAASAQATLVAVVPARDGLAVAADSRFTFMGASCDGAFKIIEPQRPLHSVAFVTGDSIFVAPPPAGENPCHYLASAPRLFDMGAVVKAWLERGSDDPARVSTTALAAECVRALQRFERSYPHVLRGYGGRDIVSVVVASYDPVRHVSTLHNFALRMEPGTGRVQATRMNYTILGPDSLRGVWIYGEAAFVNHSVYAGSGRRFLQPGTEELLRVRQPIGSVPVPEAAAAAADVVEAASRAAQIDPPASGIGGQVRVVILSGRPQAYALPHAAPR